MPADRQPVGAGGYAPKPAGFGSTIATAMLFTEPLGLVAHPLRQTVSILSDTALEHRYSAVAGTQLYAIEKFRHEHYAGTTALFCTCRQGLNCFLNQLIRYTDFNS